MVFHLIDGSEFNGFCCVFFSVVLFRFLYFHCDAEFSLSLTRLLCVALINFQFSINQRTAMAATRRNYDRQKTTLSVEIWKPISSTHKKHKHNFMVVFFLFSALPLPPKGSFYRIINLYFFILFTPKREKKIIVHRMNRFSYDSSRAKSKLRAIITG